MDDADRVRFIRSMFLFNDKKYVSSTTRKDTGGKTLMVEGKRDLLVHIHAYCLMDNHYHMLLSAHNDDEKLISLFMKKLNKGYSRYFNEKYKRNGALWQGKYKKIHIIDDAHFLHIPYYIHLNPLDAKFPKWRDGGLKNSKEALAWLRTYRWSSHLDYLGEKNFRSVLDMDILGDPNNLSTNIRYEKRLLRVLEHEDTSGIRSIIE